MTHSAYRRVLLSVGATCLLAACASPSDKNITLAAATPDAVATAGPAVDLPSQPLRYVRTKPGCNGTCPKIEVDSVSITGEPKLNQLIDHALAYMTGVDPDRRGNYVSLAEYEAHFWATAQPRDVTILKARVRDVYKSVIAVELVSGQYLTGAAHGIHATQFLNWQRDRNRVLALEEAVLPGQAAAFDAALQRAHARWKAQQPDAATDPSSFDRMWPFQPSANFALTRQGVVVKYDAYAIAPYSYGQPELIIPYQELRGVLAPEWLP